MGREDDRDGIKRTGFCREHNLVECYTCTASLPWDHPEAQPLRDLRMWVGLVQTGSETPVYVSCPPRVWALVKDDVPKWEKELTDHFGKPIRIVEQDRM